MCCSTRIRDISRESCFRQSAVSSITPTHTLSVGSYPVGEGIAQDHANGAYVSADDGVGIVELDQVPGVAPHVPQQRTGIVHTEPDLAAEDAAPGIDFGCREERAVHGQRPTDAGRPRQGDEMGNAQLRPIAPSPTRRALVQNCIRNPAWRAQQARSRAIHTNLPSNPIMCPNGQPRNADPTAPLRTPRLRSEGVPVEQWRILKPLSDGNGRSIGEVAETALLNHPTLTKTIDRMVADSLVYRISDPADRRKVLIFCSDRGKALGRKLVPLALDQEAHIVNSYGDKPTAQLRRLLKTLIERAG